MDKARIIAHTKMYMDLLAQGIDPISREKITEDSVLLQEGETTDYQWISPAAFLRLIREEPVLTIQYPRYKPYLDQLDPDHL